MPGLFDALIQQESGGRPGVVGPKTKYGRALGLTQMLPATAQEMARKIGVPFNQSMLTDKSPQGAAYQRQLGEAYFNEGLQRTGNERDALRYYHGGPDRAQWGPKTNQYADSVMARAGGNSMIRPRKPQAKAPMQPPQMAPMPMQEPLGIESAQIDMPQPGADLGAMPATLQPSKPGVFGKGGVGWKVLGVIGDGLQGYAGRPGTYAPAMQREQEMQFDREKFNQELAAKRVDAEARRIADANKPYRMQNNNGDALEIDPRTGQTRVLYADPSPKTNWTKIENPDGSVEMRPTPGASRPQPDDIADLANDPNLAADFESEFGPGTARYYLDQYRNRMGAR